ncbi:hypothetical protein [Streptomyces sp. NPDC007264]|uniref:hypothetical protein n=1 Tax=Streptomyces sp. NPDC007264 TaxID=3364777 RepID=UPI0036DE2984
MSKKIPRRCAAGAAVVALTIGLTACGGGEDKSTEKVDAPAAPGVEQAARVLTQDELDGAVVDAHDLPGLSVEKVGGGAGSMGEGGVHARNGTDTHPAACAPISAALAGASRYEPVGSVQRIAGRKGGSSVLTLVSYQAADATRVIDDLRTALKACTAFRAGWTQATYKNLEVAGDPSLGEESMSFRLTMVMEAGKNPLEVPMSVVIIRCGSTVALFKRDSEPGTSATVPSDLVNAQSKALDAAVRTR